MQCVVHVSKPVQICGHLLKRQVCHHPHFFFRAAAPTYRKHLSDSGSFDQILEHERANAI